MGNGEEKTMKKTMKFSIDSSTVGGFKVNLGENIGTFNITGGVDIDSIAVDVGMDKTKICLVRNLREGRVVNIYPLEEYKFEDVSELIFHLTLIGKPEAVYIDDYGAGVAVKDYLYPMLLSKGIAILPNGKVSYGLDEIYGRLLSK